MRSGDVMHQNPEADLQLKAGQAQAQLRKLVFDMSAIYPDMRWEVESGWPLPSYRGRCKGRKVETSSPQLSFRGGHFEPKVVVTISGVNDDEYKRDKNPAQALEKWHATLTDDRINRSTRTWTLCYLIHL